MVKLQEQTAELASAAQEFYNALHEVFQGNTASMEKIWSHADDVTSLGPQGGIIVGWNQVLQSWKELAQMQLKGKLHIQDVHMIQEGNIGIMQCYEIGTNVMHGKTEKIDIRALNIFRKENGKWKMISHQTDRLHFFK